MAVMHGCGEALLTILQVLLYDPLYAWTISPLQAYNLQQQRTADTAATAATDVTDRDMLNGDEQKLSGGYTRSHMGTQILTRVHAFSRWYMCTDMCTRELARVHMHSHGYTRTLVWVHMHSRGYTCTRTGTHALVVSCMLALCR